MEHPIPGYNLSAPTRNDALRALCRVFGQEKTDRLLGGMRSQLGFDPRVSDLDHEELTAVARQLIGDADGLARVVGRSLMIRLDAYEQLRARLGAPGEERRDAEEGA